MRSLTRWGPACLLLGVALTGCEQPGATTAGSKWASSLPVLGTAPEIQGTDQDGQVFKLSDYRGKVVLLDFWAGW
jgi:hypothetical protein